MVPSNRRGYLDREVLIQRIALYGTFSHEEVGSLLTVAHVVFASIPDAVPDIEMPDASGSGGRQQWPSYRLHLVHQYPSISFKRHGWAQDG
jgi:hypothetical protein